MAPARNETAQHSSVVAADATTDHSVRKSSGPRIVARPINRTLMFDSEGALKIGTMPARKQHVLGGCIYHRTMNPPIQGSHQEVHFVVVTDTSHIEADFVEATAAQSTSHGGKKGTHTSNCD